MYVIEAPVNFYLILKMGDPKIRYVSQQLCLMAEFEMNENESMKSSNNGGVIYVNSLNSLPQITIINSR